MIRLLWHVQPNLLLEGFFEMYKKDPTSVSRILDIAQEAKVTLAFIEREPSLIHIQNRLWSTS